jgi:hypothetical protein
MYAQFLDATPAGSILHIVAVVAVKTLPEASTAMAKGFEPPGPGIAVVVNSAQTGVTTPAGEILLTVPLLLW